MREEISAQNFDSANFSNDRVPNDVPDHSDVVGSGKVLVADKDLQPVRRSNRVRKPPSYLQDYISK